MISVSELTIELQIFTKRVARPCVTLVERMRCLRRGGRAVHLEPEAVRLAVGRLGDARIQDKKGRCEAFGAKAVRGRQ